MRTLFISVIAILFTIKTHAAEPSNQPTLLVKSQVYAWKHGLSFTASVGGATGYLVLRNTQPITDIPVDFTTYQIGQKLGSSKVFSVGSATAMTIKECVANTTYHYAVFAYNGTGASIDYKTANPLKDTVRTLGSTPGNYYQNISPANATFISDLTKLINQHTFMSYDDFEKKMVPEFYQRDTVIGGIYKAVINCEYSNEIKDYSPPFDFANTTLDYSREHVLCKNWMNLRGLPNNSDLTQYPEGCDYHNLLLTKTTNVNSKRSDYPYGKVSTLNSSYLECKFGKDISGNFVFEPKDDSKGNGSRCMFYQMICYNGLFGGWGLDQLHPKGPSQEQPILKQWHRTDGVDNFEIARHEMIASLQKNRNPFIDNPDWIDCIDFNNLLKMTCALSIDQHSSEKKEMQWVNYFENNTLHLNFINPENEQFEIDLYNASGEKVESMNAFVNIGENQLTFDFESHHTGMYWMVWHNDQRMITIKINHSKY